MQSAPLDLSKTTLSDGDSPDKPMQQAWFSLRGHSPTDSRGSMSGSSEERILMALSASEERLRSQIAVNAKAIQQVADKVNATVELPTPHRPPPVRFACDSNAPEASSTNRSNQPGIALDDSFTRKYAIGGSSEPRRTASGRRGSLTLKAAPIDQADAVIKTQELAAIEGSNDVQKMLMNVRRQIADHADKVFTRNAMQNKPVTEESVGRLIIKLSHAKNMQAADANGLSDPYVKLTLCGKTHKSKIQYKTLNPTWNEEFVYFGVLGDD